MAMTSGDPKHIVPIAVGLGTMVLAPVAAVVLIKAFKPVAGMAIKGSVLAGAFVRTAAAAAVTAFKDLTAEAKAELDASYAKKENDC
ncbi:MAG: hypothetical protein ACWGNK_01640 [Desulfobacterales bacterium]